MTIDKKIRTLAQTCEAMVHEWVITHFLNQVNPTTNHPYTWPEVSTKFITHFNSGDEFQRAYAFYDNITQNSISPPLLSNYYAAFIKVCKRIGL